LWILVLGTCVSKIGDRVAATSLGLYAARDGSAGLLTAIFVAEVLPAAVVGLVGGVLADRLRRTWLWPAVLVVQATCYGLIATTSSTVAIVALIATSATASSLLGPVSTKYAHALAGDHRALAARLTASGSAIASVVGPAVGGIVFATMGRTGAMLLDVGSFAVLVLVALLCVGGMVLVAEPSTRQRPSVRELLAGFGMLTRVAGLGRLGVLVVGMIVFGTSLEGVVGIFYFTHQRGVGDQTYGVIIACWAVGLLCGSLVPWPTRRVERAAVVVPAAGGVIGVCIGALPVFGSPVMFGVLFVVGGIANGALISALRYLIFTDVPNERQGRVWAAFEVIVNGMTLLGYLVSYAGQRVSVPGTLVFAGVVGCLVSLVGLASVMPREHDRAAH
jgi:MFS family permease